MKTNLNAVADLLGGWMKTLPAKWRGYIYKGSEVLASLATLLILLMPLVDDLGLDVPEAPLYTALLTGAVAFLGRLAGLHVAEPQPEGPQDALDPLDYDDN